MEQAPLENVRVQLRGTAGGGGRRGEDRCEGERGRGDAGREHAREEREGVDHATGAGAGCDEGIEEGRGERRARTRHPVEQAAGAAWGRWWEARGAVVLARSRPLGALDVGAGTRAALPQARKTR